MFLVRRARAMSSLLSSTTSRTVSAVRLFSDTSGPDDASESEPPLVVVEKLESHHIMTIGINRPEKRNCVNAATADQLAEAFEDFEHDENMRSAVLHGVGGCFCAGYDLEELSQVDEEQLANQLAVFMNRGPMVRDGIS